MHTETRALWNDRGTAAYTTFLHGNTHDGPKRPAMVICPGGGYLDYTAWETEPVALYFLARGFQVFVLYYSVGLDGSALYPKPVYDLAKLVLTIRENAQEFNINENKIALVAFSAGAHLGACLATQWQEPWLSAHLRTTPEAIKPNAAVFGYGVYDNLYNLEAVEQDQIADVRLKGRDYSRRQLNARYVAASLGSDPKEELLKNSSPYYHISPNMPPVFLWHTYIDPLVSVGNTLRFAAKMHEMGNQLELHIFQEGIHGMSLADAASKAWYHGEERISAPDVAVWKELAFRFLERNLNL